MRYIKPFTDWHSDYSKFNSDLFKIYLVVDPKSNQKYLNYKEFAIDNFFKKITLNETKWIDPNFPILNYSSTITRDLIEKFNIPGDKIYNHPDLVSQSGSKVLFHQRVGEHPNVPKTVFSKQEAMGLKFPVVAKPSGEHSGIGIQVFKNKKELQAANDGDFDLYSEWIDKKEEHRIIFFKEEPILWMQRDAVNGKAKTGDGEKDEEMNFNYTKLIGELPDNIKDVVFEFTGMFSELPYICFDLMIDSNNKAWIIESNVMPGVPFDAMPKLYQLLFKDWYGREVNGNTLSKLQSICSELDKKTIQSNPSRFKIKKV